MAVADFSIPMNRAMGFVLPYLGCNPLSIFADTYCFKSNGIHPEPVQRSTSVNDCREGVNRRNRLAKARVHSSVSHRGIKTLERICIFKCPNGWFSTHLLLLNFYMWQRVTTYDEW